MTRVNWLRLQRDRMKGRASSRQTRRSEVPVEKVFNHPLAEQVEEVLGTINEQRRSKGEPPLGVTELDIQRVVARHVKGIPSH